MRRFQVQSESLMFARRVKETGAAGTELIPLDPKLRVIVDTNKVLRDLVWAVSRRRNPKARQDIIEVSDAGVAVLYAPNALKGEIRIHLPSLAKQKGLSLPALREEWQEYQRRLVYVPGGRKPRQNSQKVRDRDDVPFINAYKRVDAFGIVTADSDIPAMGARAINSETTGKMRSYAREKAGELGILSAVSIPFIIGFALFGGIIGPVFRLLKKIWPILLIGAIILVLVYLHDEKLREETSSKTKRFVQRTKAASARFKRPLAKLIVTYRRFKQNSEKLWREITTSKSPSTSNCPLI